jgi:hypothetical protein
VSTKNLARTVIEGGRYRYNKFERRHSHAEVRSEERVCARDARLDPESFEDRVWPERDPVRKSFYDKLSPAEQWMRSQIGRAWNRVREELFERFDTRTLAGRHIVFDHMLPRPWETDGTWRIARLRFRVDRHGVLRLAPPQERTWRRPEYVLPDEQRAILAFVDGRRVVTRGAYAYWMLPVLSELGTRYRQHVALDAGERARWLSFTALARALVELEIPPE